MRSCRQGINLLESLVVIGILGMLLAFFWPAVSQLREAASRTRCDKNFQDLALAMHAYAIVFKGLPARRSFFAEPHSGWGTKLLPYIEENTELTKQYWINKNFYHADNALVARIPMQIYQCPSTPKRNRLLDMADIAGGSVGRQGVAGDYFACNIVEDPTFPMEGGALNDDMALPQGDQVRPLTHFFFPDGLSHTMLLREIAGQPERYYAGKVDPTHKPGTQWIGAWVSYQSYVVRSFSKDGKMKNGPCVINCTNNLGTYSFHPGGAMHLFADGSVRFLSQNINKQIYYAFVTRNGEEKISDDDFLKAQSFEGQRP